MNKQKRIIILVILIIVFSFLGSTLAYLNWQTSEEQKTNIVFTLEQDFWCAADGGGDITQTDAFIVPTTCTNATHAIQREVIVTPTIGRNGLTIYMDLWLNVNSIDTGLSNSDNFMYALTTSENSCTDGVIATGNFKSKVADDKIMLLDEMAYSTSTPQTYYLYVWLDAAETSTDTMDQSFELSLGGTCVDDGIVQPESPTLDDGMIPITISGDGTVTTISSNDSSWYNYSNKEWANAVLVSDSSRSTYKDTSGVTIDQNDILAYYVWIPRYKYKIWTTTESSAGSEQTIEIEFESQTDAMSLGTEVGEYRTHPAFWWDDDSDGVVDAGETVAGIWVGKFETSTNTDSICYTSNSTANCVASNVSPRIVPNVQSLRHQTVSTQFTTSQLFSASGNIYGLSNTSTNSHMMKNSEWGAVAYLSHSTYGINYEIRINNNYNYITGCGAATENGTSTSSCEISYNADSTPQSTTGNITGVYDMSSGVWEYVMGVLADSSGNPRSGNDTSYTSGLNFPASKYYDLYTGTSALDSCNGGVCYGHALSETANWYSDYALFVNSDGPWFVRGGGHLDGAFAGAFYSYSGNGDAYDNASWRSVLVVGYGT